MVAEVVAILRPHAGGVYVDATIGAGGHTVALLDAGAGRVIGLDRDASALDRVRARLGDAAGRVELAHADYRDLVAVLERCRAPAIDGLIADLGVSSMQLDDPDRGFSFRLGGPLDMRMDRSKGPTAAELVAGADEATLADVIWRFGEERHSRRVARAIVRARERQPITQAAELAAIVRPVVRGGRGHSRIDPATRTFQALRIWVNRELEGLDSFLETAAGVLTARSRLAVIAFHSLEDRIVKHTFRRLAAAGTGLQLVTRRSVVPDEAEIARNPRARSARLRALEKVA